MGEAGSPPPEVSASVQGDATAGAGAQPQGIPSSPRLPQAGERITGERTASTGVPRAPPPGVALLSGSQHPDAPPAGWTFFPGLDSPGGDICQAADLTAAGSTPAASPAAGSSLATGSAFAQALARVGPGGSQTTLRPMSGASCVAAVAGAATGVVLGTAADVAGLLRRARPASPPGSPAQQQQQQQQSHGMLHALIGLLPYVGGGGSNQASSSTTAITAPGNPSVPSPAAVAAAAAAVGPSGPNPLLMHMPMGVVPAGLPQGAEALAALVAEQRLQGLGAFPTAPLVFPPGFLEVSSLAPSASGALATLPGIGRRLPEGVVPAGPGPAHASTAGGNSSGQGEWWLSNVVAYNTNGELLWWQCSAVQAAGCLSHPSVNRWCCEIIILSSFVVFGLKASGPASPSKWAEAMRHSGWALQLRLPDELKPLKFGRMATVLVPALMSIGHRYCQTPAQAGPAHPSFCHGLELLLLLCCCCFPPCRLAQGPAAADARVGQVDC
jgi:hypothetical protein